LAASVRDAVREAGFPKPRVEGEGNGEWIIIDCGQAVVHVMQPSFRAYYHLEELWGEKPVRLKLGVAKPEAVKKAAVEPAKPATTLRRSNAAKIGVAEAFPSKAQIKKNLASKAAAAKKTAAKSAGVKRPAVKAPVVPLKKIIVKTSPQKPAAKSAAKPAAKRAPVRKG
jgi:ribosome-associated protein